MTDAILWPLLTALEALIGTLPAGTAPALPSLDPLWNLIGGLDGMVPIIEPLLFGLGLLSAGIAFVLLRLVLTVWNLIWP